ncbi:hypothetical protein BC937DRAFT_94990 [Endogone sp. FLAS-F59071]|nr:hypothetical protein BC937DRAFT_94990 [Endogone sp. FLAS-F59071]|eukprot:RUS20541.1 hypothetical protein BC937DRAFT_94990 [Endogone sp. FLAS-F59071]
MRTHTEDLIRIESLNTGKPYHEARSAVEDSIVTSPATRTSSRRIALQRRRATTRTHCANRLVLLASSLASTIRCSSPRGSSRRSWRRATRYVGAAIASHRYIGHCSLTGSTAAGRRHVYHRNLESQDGDARMRRQEPGIRVRGRGPRFCR